MFNDIYIVISLLFALANVVLAFIVFREKEFQAHLLAAAMLSAAVTNVSYLLSLTPDDAFMASFFSSVYFSSIDFCLLFFLAHILYFTDLNRKLPFRLFLGCCVAYGVFDVGCLMSNPITGVVLSYEQSGLGGGFWQYVPHALFLQHLGYCYLLVAAVMLSLVFKAVTVPRVYRVRYLSLLFGLVVIVVINGVFLYASTSSMLDVSVLLYSFMCLLVYQMAYGFKDGGMVKHAQRIIVSNMGSALVLFDYEDRFAYCNESTGNVVPPERRNRDYTFREFVADCDINTSLVNLNDNAAFQWRTIGPDGVCFRRCDYLVMRDKRGRLEGRLFMFSDDSSANDMLTGFQTQSDFERLVNQRGFYAPYPVGVAVCDINRLSYVNSAYGREKGDLAIQTLANAMKGQFGPQAYYIRSNEANLVVVSPGVGAPAMRKLVEGVKRDFAAADLGFEPLNIQSSVSSARCPEEPIMQAVREALGTLREKKLLNPRSSHSSLLDSFAQTLLESDLETDSHVKRTQVLGDRLGERLGLLDNELTSLALLCLLHDIGKVGIPAEILNKPTKLTESEWQVMKTHVWKGYRIAMASPELEGIAELILHHHEFWDGSGYPDGLSHESIPLLSRILSVVDTFDAMTNDRPYRRAMTVQEACDELARCANVQFDPCIVSEFLAMLEEDETKELMAELESRFPSKAPEAHEGAPLGVPRSLDKEAFESGVSTDSLLDELEYSKYVLDEDSRILEIDEAFTRITGYTREDVATYGLTQLDLLSPQDRERYGTMVQERVAAGGEAFLEHRVLCKDGSIRFVFCYGRKVFDAASHSAVSRIVFTDLMNARIIRIIARRERISARRSISMWEDSARKDPLTGLFNREVFRSEVQSALLKGDSSVLFVILDLDYFKEYNDSYGHPQGDELLKVLASGLAEAMFPNGIASRMGGDEFAAAIYVSNHGSLDDVERITRDVWDHVGSVLADYDDAVTISMGASFCAAGDAQSFSRLYRDADRALYQAKEGGRGSLRFGW